MAWVAFDRAVKVRRELRPGRPAGPLAAGCATRSTTRSAARASTPERDSFVQYYGSKELDASLLMIPLVGFLPADDPRVRGTVEAIEQRADARRLRARYTRRSSGGRPAAGRGGVPGLHLLAGRQPGICWAGTTRPASSSSGCSPCATTSACCPRSTTRRPKRLVGNFPQAFSHVGLVNTALNLSRLDGPAKARKDG